MKHHRYTLHYDLEDSINRVESQIRVTRATLEQAEGVLRALKQRQEHLLKKRPLVRL